MNSKEQPNRQTCLCDYRKRLLTVPEIAELDRKYAAELFDYLLANPLRSVINGGRETVSDRD
jgi:hypothetical protein